MLQTVFMLLRFIPLLADKDPLNTAHHAANQLLKQVSPAEATDKMTVLLDKLISWSFSMGGRVVAAIVIFIIGRFLIKILNKLIGKILSRKSVYRGVASFIGSLFNALLMLLLIVAVISKLGVETTSFAALLASFGVAVGMALSGNLQNLAGGIIVLVFRPYKVGDYISAQGQEGTVMSIQIFHTVICTYKGVNIYMPNGQMSSSTIINF